MGNANCKIEEKNGTIMNKRGYHLIFHLIPIEDNTLKNKIENKFNIKIPTEKWIKFNTVHYARSLPNNFAHRENANITIKTINEIAHISKTENAEEIAVNLSYNHIQHYIFFKTNFNDIFRDINISVTFFLNNIIEVNDENDIKTILELYHKSLLGGHIGTEKMIKTISRFYKIENITEHVRNYVKKCSTCEKTKVISNTKVPMQISSLGEMLFDHTYIDFVGPISPISNDGHRYIFTAICDLTKYMIAIPTKDCTAFTAAECLLEHILLKYNFPSKIISDNASDFTAKVIKELLEMLRIKKIFTTPYHPQSNIVERGHRTLNSFLRAFTNKNKDTWHLLTKFAMFAYNNSIHSVTGYTPHELAHGFKIRIPTHLNKPKLSYNYDSLADNTRNNIAMALELAKEHLHNKKISNKRYYDSNAKELEINVDDLILIKNQVKKDKFQNIYDGPYRVLDASDCYVEILKNNKRVKIHKNLIKKSFADHENEPPPKFPKIILDDIEINHFYDTY